LTQYINETTPESLPSDLVLLILFYPILPLSTVNPSKQALWKGSSLRVDLGGFGVFFRSFLDSDCTRPRFFHDFYALGIQRRIRVNWPELMELAGQRRNSGAAAA
jgi:hypothetical protein